MLIPSLPARKLEVLEFDSTRDLQMIMGRPRIWYQLVAVDGQLRQAQENLAWAEKQLAASGVVKGPTLINK